MGVILTVCRVFPDKYIHKLIIPYRLLGPRLQYYQGICRMNDVQLFAPATTQALLVSLLLCLIAAPIATHYVCPAHYPIESASEMSNCELGIGLEIGCAQKALHDHVYF